MRNLFALLALIGIAGVVFGVLAMVHAAPGQAGRLDFTHENYGGARTDHRGAYAARGQPLPAGDLAGQGLTGRPGRCPF